MSKTIVVNNIAYDNIDSVKTNILAKRGSQEWIPKDEAAEAVDSLEITATENSIIDVGQPISKVTADVQFTYGEKTFTENGEYDAKDFGLDGFSVVQADIPAHIKHGKAITKNGVDNAKEHGYDGYDLLHVNVEDPLPAEEFSSVVFTKSGEFKAEDRNNYGFSHVNVNVPLYKKFAGWSLVSKKPLTSDIKHKSFTNAVSCKHNGFLHIISAEAFQDPKSHLIWSPGETELRATLPRSFSINNDSTPCLLSHNGKLVLFGGYDAEIDHSVNEYWTWDGYTWTKQADITVPYVYAAVSFKGSIYILDTSGKIRRLRYGVWESMVTISGVNFDGASMVAYKDHIYILGHEGKTVYKWAPGENVEESSTYGGLNYPLKGANAVVYDDRIHLQSQLFALSDPRSFEYMTHFAYDGGTCETVSEVILPDLDFPFAASNCSLVDYYGQLHIVGVPYNSDGYFYDYVLEEE